MLGHDEPMLADLRFPVGQVAKLRRYGHVPVAVAKPALPFDGADRHARERIAVFQLALAVSLAEAAGIRAPLAAFDGVRLRLTPSAKGHVSLNIPVAVPAQVARGTNRVCSPAGGSAGPRR